MNNPLNIEYRKENNWKGAIRPYDGKRFESFENVKFGIRAGRILLKNYQKQGLNTITKVISTYAPKSENPTANYIDFVSKSSNIDKNQPLDFNLETVLFPILKAMCKFESNYNLTKNVYNESLF